MGFSFRHVIYLLNDAMDIKVDSREHVFASSKFSEFLLSFGSSCMLGDVAYKCFSQERVAIFVYLRNWCASHFLLHILMPPSPVYVYSESRILWRLNWEWDLEIKYVVGVETPTSSSNRLLSLSSPSTNSFYLFLDFSQLIVVDFRFDGDVEVLGLIK